MPELRSRLRRTRAPKNPDPILNQNPNPITQPQPQPPQKLTVRKSRTAQNKKNKEKKAVGVGERRRAKAGLVIETRSFKLDEKQAGGEGAMDEYDSGGRSADKGPGAEDEGLAPIPEKVSLSFTAFHCISLFTFLYFPVALRLDNE